MSIQGAFSHRRRRPWHLVALFAAVQAAALFIVLGAINGASAAAGTEVEIASATVGTGVPFNIPVTLTLDPEDTSDDNFDQFDITVTFNPAYVNVDTSEGDGGVTINGDFGVGLATVNNDTGTVNVTGWEVLETPCVASCELFTIHLESLSLLGTEPLAITGLLYGDTVSIDASFLSGSVTVTDFTTTPSPNTATPSPSATPSPTSSPSPSPTASPSPSPSASPSPSPEPEYFYPVPMVANDGLIT